MEKVERSLVIDQILKAKSEEEMSTADGIASRWLERSPGDLRVIAALEKLDTKRLELTEPSLTPSRMTIIALWVSLPVAVIVALVWSVGLALLVVISTVVVLEVVWEMFLRSWAKRSFCSNTSSYCGDFPWRVRD